MEPDSVNLPQEESNLADDLNSSLTDVSEEKGREFENEGGSSRGS